LTVATVDMACRYCTLAIGGGNGVRLSDPAFYPLRLGWASWYHVTSRRGRTVLINLLLHMGRKISRLNCDVLTRKQYLVDPYGVCSASPHASTFFHSQPLSASE